MGCRETLLLALAVVFAFPFLSTTGATETASNASSWDIVLARGNEIHFFKTDAEIRKFTVANIDEITALAYDNVNRTLYVSSAYDIRSYLVEENLDSELTLTFNRRIECCIGTGDGIFFSMVFDPVTKTLFWAQGDALMKMEFASYGIGSAPKISKLHADFIDKSTYELTLDICHRFIYWAKNAPVYGPGGCSIERSRLDGTDREVILTSEDPVRIFDLTVDHYGGKLYSGTSDGSSDRFKIEESNLDGTDRRVLVNNSDANIPVPKRLAVDDTAVYWADPLTAYDGMAGNVTIWKVYKNGTAMRAMKTFHLPAHVLYPMFTILTRHTLEGIDCKAVLDKEQIRTPEQLPAGCQVAAGLEQLFNKMTFDESKSPAPCPDWYPGRCSPYSHCRDFANRRAQVQSLG